MQREVPGDPGAGTSSYWVMPSNTATKISTIFRDRVITELIYLLISAAMVSMMFRRLIWIHFFYHFLAIRLYHEFLSQLNCQFDIAFFKNCLLQTTTAAKQANEILWNFTYPHWNTSDTTRKIANLYIEFNYHFLTLQKKIPLLLNRSVHAAGAGLIGRPAVISSRYNKFHSLQLQNHYAHFQPLQHTHIHANTQSCGSGHGKWSWVSRHCMLAMAG